MRSHHPIFADYRPPASDDDVAALRRQRDAIETLGAALRDLVQAAAATEAPADDLVRVAEQVRAALPALARARRDREQLPTADDLLGGIRMYNPVTGVGSALAPPLRIALVDGLVVGTCTLGLAFEGPPMYAHGGVSAMLLDQLLGYATTAAGRPGMTVELVNRYRAPVPLDTPLRLVAEVTGVDGRRVIATGMIATAADPSTVLVEATGTFVSLRREQSHRLFSAALDPDG